MTNLISGKEALIALANGDEVEFKDGMDKWENIKHHMNLDLSMFLTAPDWMEFRIKPKTISINGILVPVPFEPKVGEQYWYIAEYVSSGYSCTQEGAGINSSIGKWKSENEIKQVVAALRQVFGAV